MDSGKCSLSLALKIQKIFKNIEDPLNLRQLLLYLIACVSKELQLDSVSYLLFNKDSNEFELKESIKFNKKFLSLNHNDPMVMYFMHTRDIIHKEKLKLVLAKMINKSKSEVKSANREVLEEILASMDEIGAETVMPYFMDNVLIGILSLGKRNKKKKFNKKDLMFLNELRSSFTPLIDSAMKYIDLKTREKEMTSLYEVGKVISSLFDFKKTFDMIVRNASIILRAPKILVLMKDPLKSNFIVKKAFGFTDFQLSRVEESPIFKESLQNICGVKEGILIRNYEDNKHYEQSLLQDLSVFSVLSVPLFNEDLNIIGELRAMRPITLAPFNKRDVEVATNLANNIIVALNNSERYQKSEEHLIELSTVYNIIKSLSNEFELTKIQKKICTIFTDVLSFEKAILYRYEDKFLYPANTSKIDFEEIKDLRLDINKTIEGKALIEGRIFNMHKNVLEDYDISAIEKLGLNNFVVIPLLLINKKAIGVMVIGVGEDNNVVNMRLLTAIANQSAVILENARLYKESEELNKQLQIEQARTKKELQMAHYIQQGILSVEHPNNELYSIYGINIPCRSVGGDFYQIIEGKNRLQNLVIGDVSGKGIPAALLMTMTSSIFSENIQRYGAPEQVLNKTNEALQHYLSRSPIFYVTAFYAQLDCEAGLLRYCKAGHNPPILYKAKTKEIKYLDGEGTYLGTFDDGGYLQKSIPIEAGDKLVLYTDGLTELRNNKKEMFHKNRLAKLVSDHYDLPAEKFANMLINRAEVFSGKSDFSDDITILIADVKSVNTRREKVIYNIQETIQSKLEEVKKIAEDIMKKIEVLDISKRIYNHIRLALSESLMNAHEHGNKKDKTKTIQVKGVITDFRIEITVTDQGKGFALGKVEYYDNQQDINHRGRGIMTINACMDELGYNSKGNEITFIKYIK